MSKIRLCVGEKRVCGMYPLYRSGSPSLGMRKTWSAPSYERGSTSLCTRLLSTQSTNQKCSGEGSWGRHSCSVLPRSGNLFTTLCGRPFVSTSRIFHPCYSIPAARHFTGTIQSGDVDSTRIRNIGISAHIDSGKTTLTERVLYYTGRIAEIHEVRGTDGVGAKMDSMELEREKGITIQSAATHCCWHLPSSKSSLDEGSSFHINLIDTPGHVDFTIEVERALRVLDGAVLVVCGVAGIQSQTLTVDRQMKRYGVPRIVFVNKLDRDGADPFRALEGVKRKLALNACLVQLPIGLEGRHRGVVDIIDGCSLYFEGANGEVVRREASIPEGLQQKANEVRLELIEALAEADEDFAELYIDQGEQISADDIHQAIRRCTIKNTFAPVLIGSAKANKGVQPLLDAVCRYLPSPCDRHQVAFDADNPAHKIPLECDPRKPLVAMAFKIQELPVGQLTYLRLYQGKLKKGDSVTNTSTQKKQVVRRLLRMHSEEAKEVGAAQAGDIVAVGGVECNSGITLTDGAARVALENIYVPQPVLSLAVSVTKKDEQQKLAKALNRFQREDPTFKVEVNPESQETLISGMGELHLQIYLERMHREYNLVVKSGEPRVNYREALTQRGDYDYTHKKQSGGAGQFGKVTGYFEPLDTEAELHADSPNVFVNELVGNDIPPNFISSIEKGFLEAAKKGPLSGHPLINAKFVLRGGKSHEVDSSDIAFRLAAAGALRTFYECACPIILEPLMKVEVRVPLEQQAAALGLLNRRRGTVSSCVSEAESFCVEAFVPLRMMFGFVSDLRGCTQGQGEFSMEFHEYVPMQASEQEALVAKLKGDDTKKKDKKP